MVGGPARTGEAVPGIAVPGVAQVEGRPSRRNSISCRRSAEKRCRTLGPTAEFSAGGPTPLF